ncbi:MAG TPA: hypothetical protein VGE98_17140 [Thermoanaerobaculia bacterium]
MKPLRLLLLASALVLVSAASASAFGRICVCPDNFAPVQCSNGQSYANACIAACAGATGCVPTHDIG